MECVHTHHTYLPIHIDILREQRSSELQANTDHPINECIRCYLLYQFAKPETLIELSILVGNNYTRRAIDENSEFFKTVKPQPTAPNPLAGLLSASVSAQDLSTSTRRFRLTYCIQPSTRRNRRCYQLNQLSRTDFRRFLAWCL